MMSKKIQVDFKNFLTNREANNVNKIPILYNRKEECCGCTACYASCPKSAISMVEDEEGFEYPVIDESKCIQCYQCIKVCPLKEKRGQVAQRTPE